MKIFLSIGLAMWGGMLMASAQAPELKAGVLQLELGEYVLDFREDAAWTIGNLTYQGETLISYTGGNQAVINVVRPVQTDPSAWIGTGHGGEEVESVVLRVDGKDYPLQDSFSAPAGGEYSLIKQSRIGPFQCRTETRLTSEGMEQTLSFQTTEALSEVRYAYVFMHCWHHQFGEWLALLPDGSKLREKFPEDRATSLRYDIAALALHSESSDIGAVMTYASPYEGDPGHSNFLINWPERHHKHYLRVRPEQMAGVTYRCWIEGFSASAEEWPEKALELVKERQSTLTP